MTRASVVARPRVAAAIRAVASTAAAACACACVGPGPFDPAQGSARDLLLAAEEPSYATMNLVGAERQLDAIESELEEIGEYDVLGAEGVILPWPAVPIGLELGGSFGSASTELDLGPTFGAVDVGLDVLQLNAGLRLFLYRALPGGFPIEPFVAGGISRLYAQVDVAGLGFDDAPTGSYLRAGFQVRVTSWFHVGLDWRRLEGADSSVDVAGGQTATVDFDSEQVGLFMGVRF